MARPLRIEYENAVYHVTARGNERKRIYFCDADYRKFLQYIEEAKKKYAILLHSYVLLSNHYHLIIETPGANLSRTMHYINSAYTSYINRVATANNAAGLGLKPLLFGSRQNLTIQLTFTNVKFTI